MKKGINLIADERKRQIEVEGYIAQHDMLHKEKEFIDASMSYSISSLLAMADRETETEDTERPRWHETNEPKYWKDVKDIWPWKKDAFKPTSPLRDLVKAGALIAAAIDRYIAGGNLDEGQEDGPKNPTPNERMTPERFSEAVKAACCDRNYRSHFGQTETRDDYFIDGVQWADEHPTKDPVRLWHDSSEEPRDKSRCLVMISKYYDYGGAEDLIYNKSIKGFVSDSYPHLTGSKQGDTHADVYKNMRDHYSISDIYKWAYLRDLIYSEEDAVSNDIDEFIEERVKNIPRVMRSGFHQLCRQLIRDGAQWQKTKSKQSTDVLQKAHLDDFDKETPTMSNGTSEQIVCPHWFRAGGIEGCISPEGNFPCSECNHPDKRVEIAEWSAASTISE